jgi:hypothetical protein
VAVDSTDGTTERERVLAQIAEALHEMCQPLTALQVRLEIGQIRVLTPVEGADAAAGWAECIGECARLNASVAAMRTLVQRAKALERQERIG